MLECTRTSLNSGTCHYLRSIWSSGRCTRTIAPISGLRGHDLSDAQSNQVTVSVPATPGRNKIHDDRKKNRVSCPVIANRTTDQSQPFFLDFLYPPCRLSQNRQEIGLGQHWRAQGKSARKRNLHVSATQSRGYASKAGRYGPDPELNLEETNEDFGRGLSDDIRPGLAKRDYTGFLVSHQISGNTASFGLDTKDATDSREEEDVIHDSKQRLFNIIAYSRLPTGDDGSNLAERHAIRAWNIYENLDEDEKQDVRLRSELSIWLAQFTQSDPAQWALRLYTTLPVEARNLTVYNAALKVMLRGKLFEDAANLHIEAMGNISNGEKITQTFFRYAIDESQWELAIDIEIRHRQFYTKQNRLLQRDMFWVHVSEIPQLMLKAQRYHQYDFYRRKHRRGGSRNPMFAAHLYREAIAQEFMPQESISKKSFQGLRPQQSKKMRQLFNVVRRLGVAEAVPFLDKILSALVSENSPYDKVHMHGLVSHIFYMRRQYPLHKLSQDLLLALLVHCTTVEGKKMTPDKGLRVWRLASRWQEAYGTLPLEAVGRLMSFFAYRGRVEQVTEWFQYLKTHYPSFEDQKSYLWITIWVHGLRADLATAKSAFKHAVELAAEHGDKLDLQCWNMLLFAHAREDDLVGAADTLHEILRHGIKPDEYSFHSITEMLARRGDVEGIIRVLEEFDQLVERPRAVGLYASLITAYVQQGEIEKGESVLRETIRLTKTGRILGSLTKVFDRIMTAHARRGNLDATLSTFRWMEAEKVRRGSETYAAILLVMCMLRRPAQAEYFIKTMLTNEGVEITAQHYSIVMAGFLRVRRWDRALLAHRRLVKSNLRRNVSTEVLYLKARAMQERAWKAGHRKGEKSWALKRSINAMEHILNDLNHGELVSTKLPQHSLGPLGNLGLGESVYYETLILVHGRAGCFAAAHKLFEDYRSRRKQRNDVADDPLALQLLTAVMESYLRAEDYGRVEECWFLARTMASKINTAVSVTALLTISETEKTETVRDDPPREPEMLDNSIPSASVNVDPANHGHLGRPRLLNRPLATYLASLARQHRIRDMLELVPSVTAEGYEVDNTTWNFFIRCLCKTSPPLVSLAFSLTERHLMPSFPGWTTNPARLEWPSRTSIAQGLQYIRARYLRPGQLLPQYPTLVSLSQALLRLRQLESQGEIAEGIDNFEDVLKYVGSTRDLRRLAPKALFACQTMPAVDDRFQSRLVQG